MRIVRFSDGGSPRYGVMEDDSNRIVGLRGDPLFSEIEPSGQFYRLNEVRLLSPVIPRSKVVGVGKNYTDPAQTPEVSNVGGCGTSGPAGAKHPIIFLKPNTSVIGPDDPIVLPAWSHEVNFEGELAVVIKTMAKDLTVDEVDDVIFGYTIANDVTARDIQREDETWERSKSFDTSCPLGPWIVVDPSLDIGNLNITTEVNGQVRQDDTTAHMITPVRELISKISQCFTLLPADVILTGTPVGAGPIEHDDIVEITIENIGTLTNRVIRL